MMHHWTPITGSKHPRLLRISWTRILLFSVGLILSSACNPQPQSQGTPDSVKSVGLITAKQAHDRDQAVFLDVRDSTQFIDSHIPGAISIPLNALESRVGELRPSWWILVYCDCPDEQEAREAALYLLQNGFERANPIMGGFQGWISSGYPVEP